MELLIPGLILVALMVYASTRIKRNAARAFEAETIETDEFIIQKPEGFLHNLNGDPKYLFEAYSKEFSKEDGKQRVGTVTVTKIPDASLDIMADDLVSSLPARDHDTEIIDEQKYRILVQCREGVNSQEGMNMHIDNLFKLTEKNGAVYKLEIVAIEDIRDGLWTETFMDSFRVK
jgi:hypothetical protein